MKITEGYMPYLGYKTYYRIAGECSGNKKPLILLHGGPGSTHNYFEVLDRLADEGRAIISYDQLGCGNSYVEGHSELWCSKTWMNELIELRKYLGLNELHLLGQSWGGMLSIEYLCDHKPEGIKSVILSSTHTSSKLWAQEPHRMIKFMSQEDQDAIAKAEAELGETGRVLVRASGTENLLRVMVEGKDQKEIETMANAIADVVREAIGA